MSEELRQKLGWEKEKPDRRRPGDENMVKFVFESEIFGLVLLWPRVRTVHKKIGVQGDTERFMLNILSGKWEGSIYSRVFLLSLIFYIWFKFWMSSNYGHIGASRSHYAYIQFQLMDRLFRGVVDLSLVGLELKLKFYSIAG